MSAPDGGRRLVLAVFAAAAALNLAWLGAAPLFETTEARHAEVGREFAAEGRWLVPTHNGWPHLTKPPLTDWLVAAGIRLFGANEFGARFCTALVAALVVALAAAFAGELGGARAALAAAALCWACPLYLVEARVISIDIILAALCAGGYLAVWRLGREDGPRPWGPALVLGAMLGLGFMAKGHIILLMLLAPGLAWLVWRRRWRALAWAGGAAAPVFLLLALPWFIYIVRTFPDWLGTVFSKEVEERALGPAWPARATLYLLAGCFPILPLAELAGLGFWPAEQKAARGLLLLWILLPLFFLNVARSQYMNYVAPLMPAVAVLGGVGWSRLVSEWPSASRRAHSMAYVCAGLLAVLGPGLLAGAPFFVLRLDWDLEYGCLLVLLAAAVGLGLAGTLGVLALRRGRPAAAGGLFLAAAGCMWAASLPAIEEYNEQNTGRETCAWVRQHLPPGEPVALYRDYNHSVGFYLRRRVPVVNPKGLTRMWAGQWTSWPEHPGPGLVLDADQLAARANSAGGQWLIVYATRERELANFARQHGLKLVRRQLEPDVMLVHLSGGRPL